MQKNLNDFYKLYIDPERELNKESSMNEKILVYDSSVGYARYFEKIYKKKYEVTSAFNLTEMKNIEVFHYDSIIFMVNEPDDLQLFSKIYSSYKGIRLFLGVTKLWITQEIDAMNLKDTFIIDNELNKTDMIDFINSKLKLELA